MDNQNVIFSKDTPNQNISLKQKQQRDSDQSQTDYGILLSAKQQKQQKNQDDQMENQEIILEKKKLYHHPKYLMKPIKQIFNNIRKNTMSQQQNQLSATQLTAPTHKKSFIAFVQSQQGNQLQKKQSISQITPVLQMSNKQQQMQNNQLQLKPPEISTTSKEKQQPQQIQFQSLKTLPTSNQQQIENSKNSISHRSSLNNMNINDSNNQQSQQQQQPVSTQQKQLQQQQQQEQYQDYEKDKQKNIFANSPLKQYFDQGQGTVLGLGPRYTAKGQLINYSVIGNPAWFSVYNKKMISNSGAIAALDPAVLEELDPITQITLLQEQKRKQEMQQQLITGRASFCGSKSNLKIKKSKQDQNILTKDILLMQMSCMEEKIRQQREKENEERKHVSKFISDQISETFQERCLENYNKQQKQWENINQSILHQQLQQYYQYQQQSKQQNLQKQLEKNKKQFQSTTQTFSEEQLLQQRQLLMTSSQDCYRQIKEAKDLLELSAPTYQLTGTTNFWQLSLHNQNVKTKDYGIEIQNNNNDTQQLTSLTSANSTQANKFNNTNNKTQTVGFGKYHKSYNNQNNQSTGSFVNLPSCPYSAKDSRLQPSLECNGCRIKTYIDENDIEIIRQPKSLIGNTLNLSQQQQQQQQTLTSTQSSVKSFFTSDLFSKTFKTDMHSKHKKFIQNIFQIDTNDLVCQGESKFEREREALINDGMPRYQYYVKFTEDVLAKQELERQNLQIKQDSNINTQQSENVIKKEDKQKIRKEEKLKSIKLN